MKIFFMALLALAAGFHAAAQVSMELTLDQDQFLPSEPIRVAVKISNTSGQPLHLGEEADWLTFSVEAQDNYVVAKNREVPVVEPFDLESPQRATKHVDLQPYFQMSRPGHYKITATMRYKPWSLTVNSPPIQLDVIHGGELWSQNFGVLLATNAPPEARKYTLIKANFLREQLRLYLQVSSADGGQVYKVAALGPLVSFSIPEEQLDRASQLHLLWQTGSQSFSYQILSADGETVSRDIYDNFNSRPHLSVTSTGDIVVLGGVRRPKAGEMPQPLPPQPTAPQPSAPVTSGK
jgi:hypothetical protein